jgi:Ca2+-binding EF-hand superfamily protein
VRRLQKEFPYNNPREAFRAADDQESGRLDKKSIARLMRELNPEYTDEEIQEMTDALDTTKTGYVTFDEFRKVFIGDIRTSASM